MISATFYCQSQKDKSSAEANIGPLQNLRRSSLSIKGWNPLTTATRAPS